jgi:type III secretion system FlhB-like substrate exporter
VKTNNKKELQDLSIALGYDSDEDLAPFVSAMGANKLSKEMERVARRYGVPIVKNDQLLAKLKDLEVDQAIPDEAFLEVAKMFVDQRKK